MELRHLRYFTAVAAHGSFNRAAQVLHLTQPALSRQVRDLEDEIGVPLLERGTNAVTLTPVGEAFYEEAVAVLAHAEKAVQRARGEGRGEVLRVGYMAAVVPGLMVPAMERFQAARPRVRIELVDLLPAEMKKAARERQIDIAMLPAPDAKSIEGYRWQELRKITTTLVMAAGHPLARLKKIPPARLRGVPLIGFGRKSSPGYVTTMREHLRPFGVTPQFVALIDDGLPSFFMAVEFNRAAAVLADTVEASLPRGLTMRPFAPVLAIASILVGQPSDRANHNADVFVEILRTQVRAGGARHSMTRRPMRSPQRAK